MDQGGFRESLGPPSRRAPRSRRDSDSICHEAHIGPLSRRGSQRFGVCSGSLRLRRPLSLPDDRAACRNSERRPGEGNRDGTAERVRAAIRRSARIFSGTAGFGNGGLGDKLWNRSHGSGSKASWSIGRASPTGNRITLRCSDVSDFQTAWRSFNSFGLILIALFGDSEYTWWIPWALGIAVGCFFWFYVRPKRRRK